MAERKTDVLVAGLLCLDIIPTITTTGATLASIMVPGKLIDVSNAVLNTGGATSNTGIALHRLGFDVGILGKLGDDYFGDIILKILRAAGPHLAKNMIVKAGEVSSYSVIISPPGIDRVILHAPAANNTFVADDVPDDALDGARLLHFGYPPLMRNFYLDNGRELLKLFTRARDKGLTTSLDMARPDPDSEAGKVDWARFLEAVLPKTDVFLPSIDELIYMMDRKLFDAVLEKAGDDNPAAYIDMDTISGTADRMLAMGPAIVAFKLGNQGFYLKVTSDPVRLAAMGRLAPAKPEEWLGREIATGCRKVAVAGTLGAGDCTIAGFLGALLKGLGADEAAGMAVCTGGASVEQPDAYSGVPSWETLKRRIAAGWPSLPCRAVPPTWPQTPAGNYARG